MANAGSAFDVFVALDGPVLNGMEGPTGVLRLRYWPKEDRHTFALNFFDGASGGHAVQVNKEGTIGHAGGFSRQLIFFDTQSLQEVARFSTTNFGPIENSFQSQTHVVFTKEKEFITAIGENFWRFDLAKIKNRSLNPQDGENLGPHKSLLPHSVKLSPSGRYLAYGVMDTDHGGFARQFGVFDLQEPNPEHRARVMPLDETAWHFGFHPTQDIAYAVSECYDPGPGIGNAPFDFYQSFSIGYRRNWVWKIDVPNCRELDKISLPAFMPSHLTSDVVALGDENDTVFYNACASSTLAKVEFKTHKVEHFDERVGSLYVMTHPTTWGAALENIRESGRRVPLFQNMHLFMRALAASRRSLLDGSYGLALSPDGRRLVSCHRGLNQIWIYAFPEMEVVKKIKLPPARQFFPKYLSVFSDRRLGMHHAVKSTSSAKDVDWKG